MSFVYVIVENGEAYPAVYTTYAAAVATVKAKHKEYLEEQIKQLGELDMIESVLSDINVPEKPDKTNLYIEKGINIIIHKMHIQV
jgi:hypothetical protein